MDVRSQGATLVGLSGIDASGKGFVAAKLADALRSVGVKPAVINVDNWLNLPHVRFGGPDQGRHFYDNALRLDELFEQLILPLRLKRTITVEANVAEETTSEFRRYVYSHQDIDVILLEGIFLFQPKFAALLDLKVWVECSFETALRRAVARSQEGLGAEATMCAYESIYFPAQRLHLATDDPISAADVVFRNDENR